MREGAPSHLLRKAWSAHEGQPGVQLGRQQPLQQLLDGFQRAVQDALAARYDDGTFLDLVGDGGWWFGGAGMDVRCGGFPQ